MLTAMYSLSTSDGVLHITRPDGAGYRLRFVGPGILETCWVGSDGAATGAQTLAPEDFLRQRPDVLVSPDCAAAVRSHAYRT